MEDQHMSCDIISTLPSNIIETILSLLPIQEAVRTSILSRKWRYSWVTIPKLKFTQRAFKVTTDDINGNEMTIRSKLFSAICQTLLVHCGPIHEFSLTMNADDSCFPIDQIILHLSKNHAVKKLKLRLFCDSHSPKSYRAPLSILSFHQLTHLYLSDCNINHFPTTCTGFGNLTKLHLEDVELTTENLRIISRSPLLRSVTLIETLGLNVCNWNIADLFSLRVIEHLDITHSFIQLSPDVVIPREPLVHLKTFCCCRVKFCDNYGTLRFLIHLIRYAPNLEQIILVIGADVPEEYDQSSEIASIDYSGIWLEHLYELQIENFLNSKHEMEFVKLILIKSPVLEKVSIVLDLEVGKDEELKTSRILLCSPRASPVVDIIVKHPCR